MVLREGDKAPDFNLKDTSGKQITLNGLLGKRIVIYFYPKDDTPGCTIEACEIRDSYSIFKETNIVVLGVSSDSIESHQNFTDKFNLPFPLLADVNKSMCADYDVLVDKIVLGHTVKGITRITFLIDELGMIKKIVVGHPGTKIPITPIPTERLPSKTHNNLMDLFSLILGI